jgi:thiosulfate dehydrogenase [quinone] large subunit
MTRLSSWQKTILVVLRFAIGWHLFYQGFGKIVAVEWSAEGYLSASWGPFIRIAENPTLLWLSDLTTIWGLMILGFFLMIGLFTRFSAVLGAGLLFMIYVAVPPLDYSGFVYSTNQGSELYVDKTLIEVIALIVTASFDTGRILGLDILVRYWRAH